MTDILCARSPAGMPHSTNPADLAIWRDAAGWDARAAICWALAHPLAPGCVRRAAAVRVALASLGSALKAHGSPDRSCLMPDDVAAWVVQAHDLLAMAAERLEGGGA